MPDFYVADRGRRIELGETDICMIGDLLPGTAFASELGDLDRPEIVVDVDALGIDRDALRSAVLQVLEKRKNAIWAPNLEQLAEALAK